MHARDGYYPAVTVVCGPGTVVRSCAFNMMFGLKTVLHFDISSYTGAHVLHKICRLCLHILSETVSLNSSETF